MPLVLAGARKPHSSSSALLVSMNISLSDVSTPVYRSIGLLTQGSMWSPLCLV